MDGDSTATADNDVMRGEFIGSSTSRLVAMAGLAAASAAVTELDVIDSDNNNITGSLSSVATAASSSASLLDDDLTRSGTTGSALNSFIGGLSRRNYGAGPFGMAGSGGMGLTTPGGTVEPNQPTAPSIQEVRKFVFQASRTDKRVLGGLKAHTFSSQAFISSFAVGLAIGSILAIIFKILSEIWCRIMP